MSDLTDSEKLAMEAAIAEASAKWDNNPMASADECWQIVWLAAKEYYTAQYTEQLKEAKCGYCGHVPTKHDPSGFCLGCDDYCKEN